MTVDAVEVGLEVGWVVSRYYNFYKDIKNEK